MSEQTQMAAREALEAAREPRAAGPGPEAERLRRAYLDLLKLCLCDLAGVGTTSVGAMPDRTVVARELTGDARRVRVAGMDWPLHGLTMVGMARLDDLQACVEAIVAEGIPGDLVEAGSWRGGASILMRATLDSLGDRRTVWVADSFAGFPADEPSGGDLDAFDFLAAPLDEVREAFARLGVDRGVELVPGFFEVTLPRLAGRRWALVRLDADTYEPTRLALRSLYPGLSVGGRLVIDDYGSFEGCRRAVEEYRAEHGITEPIEPIDFTGVRWRRTSDVPIQPQVPSPPATSPHAVERPAERHVPTVREIELEREVAKLRDELAALRTEVGLRPWLRRASGRLGR